MSSAHWGMVLWCLVLWPMWSPSLRRRRKRGAKQVLDLAPVSGNTKPVAPAGRLRLGSQTGPSWDQDELLPELFEEDDI